MTAPSLSEFILARVAEEEAAALPPGMSRIVDDHGRTLTLFPEVNRTLARCEVVREIVGRMQPVVDIYADERIQGAEDETEWICQIIAKMWSDHPDYREEWRP